METFQQNGTLNALTEKIIGCAFTVGRVMGCGFLEKVYENAMVHELRRQGLSVEQQRAFSVYYDDVVVGDYAADIVVEQKVLVELKAVPCFNALHMAQCLNYLRATKLPLCLLINFGPPKVTIKRIILD